MTHSIRVVTLMLMGLLMVAGRPTVACAQSAGEPSRSNWDGLRPKNLTTVYVRDTDGVDTTGKLLAFSQDALVLLVNGEERRLERSRVLRVQTRDSLKNGTIIGAITGLVAGVLTAGIADCTSDSGLNGCPGMRVSFFALATATYAGLGAGIDALIPGRTTIYSAPPASRASIASVKAPAVRLATVSW